MEIDPHKRYAVITGDVIGSSHLADRDRRDLFEAMKRGSGALRSVFGGLIPLEVDIFRGDSWQMLVEAPETSLRIGLMYRLHLRTSMADLADTRVAIGVGRVAFVPGERVGEGEGSAFRLSGQALEEMPAFCATGFRMEETGGTEPGLLDSAAVLLDGIVSGWTQKQALAVYGALQGWTQKRIGTLWDPPISQQSVGEYLQNARWRNIKHFLAFFEERGGDLFRSITGF
jgi:hypothetical protein